MSLAEPYSTKTQNDAEVLFRLTDQLYRARSDRDVYDAALDAITDALGCARASILLFDDLGVMRFVAARGLSDEYRSKLEGHTPWKRGESDPQPIFVSDIDGTGEADWIKTAIRKEGIRALSFVPLVARGGCIGKFMTYYEAAREFSQRDAEIAVTIARQVGFSVERTCAEAARQSAEHDLRESEERFRQMSEQAPVMIWLSDAGGKCLHLNRLLREFWNVADGDLKSFDWSTTMHPDDRERIGASMMQALRAQSDVSVQGRYRDSGGRYRVLQTTARPRFVNGEFVGMIGVNIDVTEREKAENARRQAEANRELLVAELNHRVKNTLSVVQAIAHQTFRGVADNACAAFEGRLLGLARSHDLLTHSNWEAVSLQKLANMSVETATGSGERVEASGPEVVLSAREAVALGMALHELATNALKYGALSNDKGRVGMTWNAAPEDELEMRWEEADGPPVTVPARTGFGTLMLQRILAGDLNATVDLDFRPAGLVCTIRMPRAALRPAK